MIKKKIISAAVALVLRALLQKVLARLTSAAKIADANLKGKSADYEDDLERIKDAITSSITEVKSSLNEIEAANA